MWKYESASDSNRHPHLLTTNDFVGRQTWVYDPTAGTPSELAHVEACRSRFTSSRNDQKHSSDELLRAQYAGHLADAQVLPPPPTDANAPPTKDAVVGHLRGALGYYSAMQTEDGHWAGDYGGPMFLMPGLVIALYVSRSLDSTLSPQHKLEMLRYLKNHQNEDGGFGLHIEGHSTMFGTSLSYVSMRILGMGPDDPETGRARSWIHSRGGAQFTTSWGKCWLAVLGVYDWMGQNPLASEAWLLPYSKLTGVGYLHPGRFWCHCRMVYLPMAYLYAKRAVGPMTELVVALRCELYTQPYDSLDWNACRNLCAAEDLYYPHPWAQDLVWWGLYQLEPLLDGSWLRKRAMAEIMEQIHFEDENSRYVCIGPVNKALNMLACYFEAPDGLPFRRHLARVPDYLWVAEDGMKMQGYNGSQLWDTAFSLQAIVSTGLGHDFGQCLKKGANFLERTQVRADCPGPLERHYRHISNGAWPFSTADHGWPISDCTSEGLKAVLALRTLPAVVGADAGVSDARLEQAINVILSYQNHDGGWATYENTRSLHALELLNPAETFGDIIVDYSYVECSSACITALAAFKRGAPSHRAPEVETAMRRGKDFILSIQRPDGSWYGSWGVCFTYGCWFGIESLAAMGDSCQNSEPMRRAADFLVSKQREDGGWGESYLSCQDKVYSQAESQVVNTAWGMLGLLLGRYHEQDPEPLHAAARFLLVSQLPNGDWPQQRISGVFNRNCMITYANYRCLFPIWALGLYRKLVLEKETH